MRQAQLRVEGAQADLGRMKQAHENHAVSEAEFDLAQREVELKKVELETARVERRAAQDRLEYTHIKAPIDGVVIVRNVEPGEVVTAGVSSVVDGAPDLTIAQVDKLLLQIDLNQVDVAFAGERACQVDRGDGARQDRLGHRCELRQLRRQGLDRLGEFARRRQVRSPVVGQGAQRLAREIEGIGHAARDIGLRRALVAP